MKKIELGKLGPHLGTRYAASSIRKQIVSLFNNADEVVFDFKGVETISEPFADECFAKLVFNFNFMDIKNKTSYRNISPFVEATISSAYKKRLSGVEV